MPNFLKSLLRRTVFKNELEELRVAKATLIAAAEAQEAAIKALSPVDVVREQLKAFDPKLLDDANDLPEILGEVEAQNVFLAKMKTLQDTPELWQLIDYLKRNQILHAAVTAKDLDAINFARATINGWSLLREEVDRLATLHAERTASEPTFDEHEVV